MAVATPPRTPEGPALPFSPNTPAPCHCFSVRASVLHPRSVPRLLRLLRGAVLAAGRRPVTRWLRAAGVADDYRPAYTTVAAAGKRTDLLAARLVHSALRPMLDQAERLTFAIDDTPTERYGPEVEGDRGGRRTPHPMGRLTLGKSRKEQQGRCGTSKRSFQFGLKPPQQNPNTSTLNRAKSGGTTGNGKEFADYRKSLRLFAITAPASSWVERRLGLE